MAWQRNGGAELRQLWTHAHLQELRHRAPLSPKRLGEGEKRAGQRDVTVMSAERLTHAFTSLLIE